MFWLANSPRLKSRAFPTAAFGKLFCKRFRRIILGFASFWPTLSWRFKKFAKAQATVEKPRVPNRSIRKNCFQTVAKVEKPRIPHHCIRFFLNHSGRIILRSGVFWPTLFVAQKSLRRHRPQLKKAACHAAAFGKLLLCVSDVSFFVLPCLANTFVAFGQHFRGVSRKFAKARPCLKICPKHLKNNFPNAVVGNARLFNRGQTLETFLKRHESVGQNTAKRRMIRPKRFKNYFPMQW